MHTGCGQGLWRRLGNKAAVLVGVVLGLVAPPLAAAPADDFLAARTALRQGNLQEVAARAQALSRDPLGIYPRYWLLSAQLGQLQADQILPFLDYYQGSWLAEKLRGEWLRQLGKQADWSRYHEQYGLLQDVPGLELQCYDFQARLAAGDKAALVAARQQLWFSARDLPSAACDPVLAQLLATGTVSTDDIWARLRLALAANAQGLARHLADKLGQTLTAAELARLYAEPAAWLKKPGQSGRLQQELVVAAVARLARSDTEAALAAWQRWQPQLPESLQAYGWRRLATVTAFRLDARALGWFDASGSRDWDDYSAEWLARLALRQQDWPRLRQALTYMSAETRGERVWQYWLARADEAGERPAPARKRYAELSLKEDYYGLLARERLGPVMSATPAHYQLQEADRRRLATHAGLQRALALQAMDMRTAAVQEWNWALRGADDRLLLAAADAASQAGWYDRAIYAAERTQKLHSQELRYLAPYRDIVREYAASTGLDEAWVYGLMRQESRFVSSARSGVGAGGLMQLMPSTARWVAGKLGLSYEPAMVNDAGTNVQLGTWYLRHVQDELSGQAVLATAAYNAGPNRARDWQDAQQALEAPFYIDSIPFSETRDYVKKVMSNAVHYARAFGQGETHLGARLGVIPPRNPQPIEGP